MKAFVLPTIFTAVDKFTSPVQKMNGQLKNISQSAMRTGASFAIAGAAILAPLAVAANQAIKFEDRMADVAKTTGIASMELTGLGEDILKMSTTTRTPIEGLQKIAEIGGQMGIQGRKGILAFTESVNKFNVALGSDFSGGVEEAARAIGGLNTLFKETRKMDVADSITKIGSAINALSAKGVVVPEVTEFIKRIGQLPDAIKPSVQDVAALGATLTKLGIPAEIAARGVGDVLLTATQNAPKFAKQMGISTAAVQKMINTNPVEFLKRFSAGFKGMDASKMGPMLKDLKLGDVGSVKVIGSLSTSMEMLSEFQKISNAEFSKGTSLLNEYNVKNATTAAKLAIAKNNFEALSIMVGTELLPVVAELIRGIVPLVQKTMNWVRANKPLVATLLKVTIGVAALMFAVSAVSYSIALYANVVRLAMFAQVAWNIAMAANPIGIIIVGIAALVALISLAIVNYNKWGAILLMVLGPLGIMINLIMTFRKNWEMIKNAFTEGGILAGLRAIGATLIDVILYPMQQLMELVAKFTGADWAASAANSIKMFRADLGVDAEVSNNNESLQTPANPQAERNDSMVSKIEKTTKNNLAIDINDPNNRTSVSKNTGGIPIKVSSTHNYGR